MDWKSEYLIPLYQALCVPCVIFLVGYAVELIGKLLGTLFAKVFGEKTAFFIMNRLTFAGTVHHELAHALFAFISGAKVTKVELFRVRGTQLGCVEFCPRGNVFTKAVQISLASIAPVICGGMSLCIGGWIWIRYCTQIWHYVLNGYLMVSIFIHMNMSRQDIKNALKGMPLTLVVCYVIFLLLVR